MDSLAQDGAAEEEMVADDPLGEGDPWLAAEQKIPGVSAEVANPRSEEDGGARREGGGGAGVIRISVGGAAPLRPLSSVTALGASEVAAASARGRAQNESPAAEAVDPWLALGEAERGEAETLNP